MKSKRKEVRRRRPDSWAATSKAGWERRRVSPTNFSTSPGTITSPLAPW
jgi:hypothetical protein